MSTDPTPGLTAEDLRTLADDIAAINEIGDLTAWTHRMEDVPEPAEAKRLDLSIFREVNDRG